jgi:hypothetical protein
MSVGLPLSTNGVIPAFIAGTHQAANAVIW